MRNKVRIVRKKVPITFKKKKCSGGNRLPYRLDQWFSNFLHQVPPQKIFGFPSTTIMTNIKMQYKWLPTAPGVCSRCVCVCVCVCVFTAVCVCTLDGLNAEHKFRVCHVTFTFSSTIHSKKINKKNQSVFILIKIFIIVSLLNYSKYTVWTWTLHRAYFHINKKNVIIKLKYIVPKSEIKTVLYLNVKKLYLNKD